MLIKVGTHSPRCFHPTYPFENKPNDVSFSFQMSCLTISKCYEEILVDPSLWQLFLEEEWRFIHKLPFLGTPQFWIVSERLFSHLMSPSMWGKARVEFITSNGQKISGEIAPMAVLVTNGVEEGSLGMGTTFCHHDQVKVEPLELLPTLLQWLSQTECSGGKDICQFTLPPVQVFQLPLSGHNHSFSGCFSCPIPTGSAAPTQAVAFFIHSGSPAVWGWSGNKSLSILLGNTVRELWGWLSPVRSCAAVDPSLFFPSSLRRELTDWGGA